jgi:hypothetical protein
MGWMTEGSDFEIWKGKELSLLHVIKTGSGVNPASYPMDTMDAYPRGKAAGA